MNISTTIIKKPYFETVFFKKFNLFNNKITILAISIITIISSIFILKWLICKFRARHIKKPLIHPLESIKKKIKVKETIKKKINKVKNPKFINENSNKNFKIKRSSVPNSTKVEAFKRKLEPKIFVETEPKTVKIFARNKENIIKLSVVFRFIRVVNGLPRELSVIPIFAKKMKDTEDDMDVACLHFFTPIFLKHLKPVWKSKNLNQISGGIQKKEKPKSGKITVYRVGRRVDFDYKKNTFAKFKII